MKKFNIKVNGTSYEVEVEEEKAAVAAPAPKAAAPAAPKAAAPAAPAAPAKAAVSAGAGEASVNAPMPGKIVNVLVSEGQKVNAGWHGQGDQRRRWSERQGWRSAGYCRLSCTNGTAARIRVRQFFSIERFLKVSVKVQEINLEAQTDWIHCCKGGVQCL